MPLDPAPMMHARGKDDILAPGLPYAPSLEYYEVAQSRPHLPFHVPEGLAAICRRAMSRNPADRFSSAEAMRRAVRDFLRRRGAESLALQAEASVDQLDRLLEGTKVGTEAHRDEIYRLYGACRFGFLEALAAWPDAIQARDGMARAATAMIGYELDQGDPRAASALLTDLAQVTEPPDALRARVLDARRRQREERERLARLEQLGRDFDLSLGARARVLVAAIALGVWTLLPMLGVLTIDAHSDQPTSTRMAGYSAVSVLVFLSLVGLTRKALLPSAVNRKLVAITAAMMAAQAILHLATALAGFPSVVGQVNQLFLWFCVTTMVAFTIEVRLIPSIVGYLVSFFVAAAWPELRFFAMAAGNIVLSVNVVWIWLPHRFQPDPHPDPHQDPGQK